jgi:hypothetical protein
VDIEAFQHSPAAGRVMRAPGKGDGVFVPHPLPTEIARTPALVARLAGGECALQRQPAVRQLVRAEYRCHHTLDGSVAKATEPERDHTSCACAQRLTVEDAKSAQRPAVPSDQIVLVL